MISENLLKLIEKHGILIGQLSLQTIQMLNRLWSPYRQWTDHDVTLAQAARSATTVEAGMRAARQRERMFMRFLYKELDLTMPSNQDVDSDGGLSIIIEGGVDLYLRDGVTPLDVYQRPAEEYRYWVSTGLSEPEALAKSLERLDTIADTDLTLARRDEARRVMRNTKGDKITGYRRIIHPELSQDGASCGLCVVASTRVYHTDDLMPIHDHCNCDVLPITRNYDPGEEMNKIDLQRIYDAAAQQADSEDEDSGSTGTSAGDLLKTKVFFLDHGELGPIISGGNRQGSKQRKANRDRKSLSPVEVVEHQLEVLRKSSENLLRRSQAGEDLRQPINWQRDRIHTLERQLITLRRRG